MISVIKNLTNKFGDIQYIETELQTESSVNVKDLDWNKFWTIKNPSQNLKQVLFEANRRKYGENEYIMSIDAFNKIPSFGSGSGAVCVLSFDHEETGDKWFILTADNKPYFMNSGGQGEPNESFDDCVVREVMEELKLELKETPPTLFAEFGFKYSNPLVDSSWETKTYCYHQHVNQSDIQHLILERLDPELSHKVFFTKDYSFSLDETKMVLFVNWKKINEIPVKIENKSFDGHHKKVIFDSLLFENNINVDYLSSYKLL